MAWGSAWGLMRGGLFSREEAGAGGGGGEEGAGSVAPSPPGTAHWVLPSQVTPTQAMTLPELLKPYHSIIRRYHCNFVSFNIDFCLHDSDSSGESVFPSLQVGRRLSEMLTWHSQLLLLV